MISEMAFRKQPEVKLIIQTEAVFRFPTLTALAVLRTKKIQIARIHSINPLEREGEPEIE